MTKAAPTIAALAAILISLSCSSASVRTDFDHQVDFSNYRTFAWNMQSEGEPKPTAGVNQIVDGRIRGAIESNLVRGGLSPAEQDAADLFVTYYASLSQQTRMYSSGWGYGWGYGPRWGYGYSFWPGWNHTSVSTWHEGSIIVDIVDQNKKQLVWRGVITKALNKKSSSEEMINESMDKVMSAYPPS